MEKINYRELGCSSPRFWTAMGVMAFLIMLMLAAVYYMEHNGHYVTGMTNHMVWGLPHVVAIFLIVAASGALNVASIGSVFGKSMYKPLGRLSSILALALLAGGLMVLVLDLGRPDRLIVAMTKYNFKSIFAWNIYLYTGFFGVVGFYLWAMIDRKGKSLYRPLGITAFLWRLALTTGTGSIFGFLVAREAYDAAIMAPMFIMMSFSFGLAFFILTMMTAYWWDNRPIGDLRLAKLKNLLGVFVAAVLYFVVVYHLANLYITQHHGIERFILMDGGVYTKMFWIGQVLIGGVIPLILIYSPAFSGSRSSISAAALMVLVGGFCQVYVIIIGSQAFPMAMFPGKEVISSSFFDGVINSYSPTLAEVMLGFGGLVIAIAIVTVASRVFPMLPDTLEDPDSI